MEALVAVGLAGNVVQFVQFSAQLISIAKDIKKTGAPASLLELKELTQNLTQQTQVIVMRLKANTATLEQEEQHLLNVAIDCEKSGKEFIEYIDGLISHSKSSSSALGSARSSIKIQWHQKRIDAYISRLEKLQGSLALATTLSLRTRESGNHEEVLGHLRCIEAGTDASQQNDDELRESLRVLQDFVEQQSGPKLDALQHQMDSCMQDIQSIRFRVTDTREKEILRWLDFRQKTWRFHEVESAHQKTFDWIFQAPHNDTPWHDFKAYLREENTSSVYFINGKAGSGKSTLMKFISTHARTTTELRKWAGKHKLAKPHFFFWNVGTQLQKSHTGLLRTLLHHILEQYHDLIPAVFPHLYSDEQPLTNDEAPSYVELKSAFEQLKSRSASFLRICIFIDGIDEFEGDHRDMSIFLCAIASSAFKVVVSSRPINACLNAFRDCPTLRLQDLTRNDMNIFIQDRLSLHPMMVDLQEESPDKARTLIAEIQEKAEGVFLWVRLVTGLLLRGLEDGDDLDDLLPKLRALPSDLRELYTRMMNKMPSDYQVQAAQIFQLFEWWRLHGHDESLELLMLSFAIKPPSYALSLPVKPWESSMHKNLTKRTEALVRSRCCGLLEVRDIMERSIFWPPTPVVTYLHRSVAEFLSSEKVWDDMLSLTKAAKFSPGTNIAFGILSIMRTSDSLETQKPTDQTTDLKTPKVSNRTNYMEGILDLAMDVCRQTTDTENSLMFKYMEAVDFKMATHTQSTLWSTKFAPSCVHTEIVNHSNRDQLWNHASIYTFAAYTGYHSYLKAVLRETTLEDVELLILFALGSWVDRRYPFEARRETLRYLLQVHKSRSRIGIGSVKGNNTLWGHAVVVVHGLLSKTETKADVSNAQEAGEILQLFLSLANEPKKLVHRDIKSPHLATIRPFRLVHQALNRGRKGDTGWALQPGYRLLRSLVA